MGLIRGNFKSEGVGSGMPLSIKRTDQSSLLSETSTGGSNFCRLRWSEALWRVVWPKNYWKKILSGLVSSTTQAEIPDHKSICLNRNESSRGRLKITPFGNTNYINLDLDNFDHRKIWSLVFERTIVWKGTQIWRFSISKSTSFGFGTDDSLWKRSHKFSILERTKFDLKRTNIWT